MTIPRSFARLRQIGLRQGWSHEAHEFTPWLAEPENISLLSETIGMPLEVQSVEERVGPFRADIVCRCPTDDSLVLLENQIEPTDHAHLGQVLTYAAGLEAATIVWIAARFTDEHRGTLDWLNRMTAETLKLYGIEIELWRIGDSALAPKFNLIARPNEAVRTATAAARSTEITPLGEARRDYWKAFAEVLNGRNGPYRLEREIAAGHIAYPLRDRRCALVVYRSQSGPGIFLRTAKGADGELARRLEANRASFEAQAGLSLAF